MTVDIRHADCLDELVKMEPESIDAIVTDPPYGLAFMGHAWDHNVPGPDYWRAIYRVMKPGSHLLAFGGARTFHRMAVAIEDSGFEIRDTLSWLYGSGFPKSHNLHGEYEGWGTALKPAWEPIIVARRPFVGTVASNVIEHGTGAMNIAACRIGITRDVPASLSRNKNPNTDDGPRSAGTAQDLNPNLGRWPANVILDESAAAMLDAQSGITSERARVLNRNGKRQMDGWGMDTESKGVVHGDTGGASRFFYVAKASRSERNAGLDDLEERKPHHDEPNGRAWDIPGSHSTARANHHPTVKPIALMRWLVQLVTPPGGIVCDPFAGSCTTGIACVEIGISAILIERELEYVEIGRRRVAHAEALRAERERVISETPNQLTIEVQS